MATERARTKRRHTKDAASDPALLEGTEVFEPMTNEQDESTPEDQTGRRRPATAKSTGTGTRLERIESMFRIVSLVAISVSVVLTAFQFYQGRIDDRRARSVELMNRWQGSEESVAFARLSTALQTRLDSLDTIKGQVTPGAMRAIKYRIGDALVLEWSNGQGPPGWEEDLDLLFTFYSEVQFCIRAELCDAPLLEAYFGNDAIDFWEYFQPYAELRRNSYYPNYGRALDDFVAAVEGGES
ncbi:MAG: hypothetical protein AAGI03_00325 [Pseudomonadota bacterium]